MLNIIKSNISEVNLDNNNPHKDSGFVFLPENKEIIFNQLYDEHAPAIYKHLYDMLNNRNIAEEALQDTFLKVWNNLHKYDPKIASLFIWILWIARNTAIDIIRSKDFKNNKKNESLTDLPLPEGTLQEDNGIRPLAKLLKKEHSELIELSYFQGYTQAEISQILGIPLGTVKTRVSSAIRSLRKMMKSFGY
ncbi:RNA polymerase sigma factor [Chitinophaga silvatica]|uniref:RNA polymerase sigma factor n=1 Tax=Chitinophaga silvatica TaxID=2282649 RepID=UPI00269B070D|nr:sigma-70 family RNA polymerase sigma factor [Chitinophaga silvatica]